MENTASKFSNYGTFEFTDIWHWLDHEHIHDSSRSAQPGSFVEERRCQHRNGDYLVGDEAIDAGDRAGASPSLRRPRTTFLIGCRFTFSLLSCLRLYSSGSVTATHHPGKNSFFVLPNYICGRQLLGDFCMPGAQRIPLGHPGILPEESDQICTYKDFVLAIA